jgi:hypothetical protein
MDDVNWINYSNDGIKLYVILHGWYLFYSETTRNFIQLLHSFIMRYFSYICGPFAEAGERCSFGHLVEKSVINMIWLLLPVLDSSNIMFGPGGLLLVVPTHLQYPFQFYGGGVAKNSK